MSKSIVCFMVLAGLIFIESSFGQEPPGNRGTLRQRLLERFDKDGDGKLSVEERQAALKSTSQEAGRNSNAATPDRMTWTINGEERQALVYLPNLKPVGGSPVVFGFHGHGGSAANADRSFGFQRLWPEAIVVYMQGLPTPGQLTDPEGKRNGWQHEFDGQGGRDLKFFDAVLKTLREKHAIDESRIYASGHSNGGGFSYLLWANRPEIFAAIAPSAAGSRSLRTMTPNPIPVMHLAGRNDQLVHFKWQELTMQRVRQINGCQAEGKPWDKGCTLYSSRNGADFVAYIHEGTHKYPVEGPALIVKFFQQYKKPAKPAEDEP